jgi:cell division protein ZapA
VKRTVQVEIAGQQLSIRSDEGPEYVQELADYVDSLVRELTGGQRTVSPQRVALLVAVQIADELFREKDLNQRFRARVEGRLRALETALHDHEQLLEELG